MATIVDKLPLWICILVCLALIIPMQYRQFGAAAKSRAHDSVSSFFLIHEIVDKWQRNVYAIVALVPLSFVFVVVAYSSESFGKPFIDTHKQRIADWLNVNADLISGIPEELYPAIILAVSYLVFGAQLKFLYSRIEQAVVFAAGIIHRTNRLSRRFSVAVLNRLEYAKAVAVLQSRRAPGRTPIPLAEELEDAAPHMRLAFQMLHLAKEDTAELGLRAALAGVFLRHFRNYIRDEDMANLVAQNLVTEDDIRRMKAALSEDGPPSSASDEEVRVRRYHLVAGVVIFLIVCGLYTVIVPLLGDYMVSRGIAWPSYEYIWSHALGVAWVAVGTIVPTVVGVILVSKRLENVDETTVQTIIVVFSIVFVLAVLGNLMLQFAQRLGVFYGDMSACDSILIGTTKDFFGLPEIVYVVTHSLVPGLAVVAAVLADRSEILSRKDIAVAVAVICIGHALAYLAFDGASSFAESGVSEEERRANLQEGYALLEAAGCSLPDQSVKEDPPGHYYIHQALLGLVLSIVALTTLRIFWRPEGEGRGNVLYDADLRDEYEDVREE